MKTNNKSEKQLWPTACHEAGHAFAQWHFGHVTRRVTVVPTETTFGMLTSASKFNGDTLTYASLSRAMKKRWEERIIIGYAGRAAAARYADNPSWRGCGQDLSQISDILIRLYSNEKTTAAAAKLYKLEADDLVATPRASVCIPALAKELIARKTLSGIEVSQTFKNALRERLRPTNPVAACVQAL